MAEIEKVLEQLLELIGRVCRELGGSNRFGAGDAYCLTFPAPGVALEAAERLRQEWSHLQQHDGHRCPMNVAVHKRTLNLFRSYIFGNDVNDVMMIESRSHPLTEGGGIFVTGRVRDHLVDTPWTARLQPVELPNKHPRLEGIAVYQLV